MMATAERTLVMVADAPPTDKTRSITLAVMSKGNPS